MIILMFYVLPGTPASTSSPGAIRSIRMHVGQLFLVSWNKRTIRNIDVFTFLLNCKLVHMCQNQIYPASLCELNYIISIIISIFDSIISLRAFSLCLLNYNVSIPLFIACTHIISVPFFMNFNALAFCSIVP